MAEHAVALQVLPDASRTSESWKRLSDELGGRLQELDPTGVFREHWRRPGQDGPRGGAGLRVEAVRRLARGVRRALREAGITVLEDDAVRVMRTPEELLVSGLADANARTPTSRSPRRRA